MELCFLYTQYNYYERVHKVFERIKGESAHIPPHLTHRAWHMVKFQEVLATIMFSYGQIESLISIINTVQMQAKDGLVKD